MDKVLVKLYVPTLEKQYDVWIPVYKRLYNVIILLKKMINELNGDIYDKREMPVLYNRFTAEPYDINMSIKETDIRNGSELVMI